MEEHDYIPTKLERYAYNCGFTSAQHGDMKLDIYPPNPYDDIAEQFLWETWEIGFNDSFEALVELRITARRLLRD